MSKLGYVLNNIGARNAVQMDGVFKEKLKEAKLATNKELSANFRKLFQDINKTKYY